jgi:hypothetical protein
MARHKIEMNGAENFKISDTSPNVALGQPPCACGSWRCPGPYLVFPTRTLPSNGRAGFVSISVACAKKGVLKVERGDEVGVVGPGRPDDEVKPGRTHAEPDNPYFKTGPGLGESARSLYDAMAALHEEGDE